MKAGSPHVRRGTPSSVKASPRPALKCRAARAPARYTGFTLHSGNIEWRKMADLAPGDVHPVQ